ncbi:hypothetical protein [Flavobacterium sp. DG2-3]|uniref:hypothetical protein n=1 Tax=Flavobacterium sp. DG2-3 TaxID=3068317 RepID=UPI00273D061B|nr:hypothetical protein [Flavobacterium sp. DG2-3]MDP5200243.1 hypothetical protein [Flavobacterium sp. DG2-3]
MKLILYFFLLAAAPASAQAIAELKFEEAETAYNQGRYELTIQKVNEFEKAVGGVSDKSLYLRVVSQDKLLDPSTFYDDQKQFDLYLSLSADAEKYIKAMESKGLDDKFKEVYAISEKLKSLNLPKSRAAYLKESTRIAKEKQEISDKCSKGFDALSIDSLPFDITLDEFLSQYPNALGEKKYKLTKGTRFDLYQPKSSYDFYSTDLKFDFLPVNILYGTVKTGDISILVKDNKIIGYQKQILWDSGKVFKEQEFSSSYNELYSKYSQLYNCAPMKQSEEILPEGLRQVSYWKLNGKTLLINKSHSRQAKYYYHSLICRVTKSDQAVEGF